MKSYKIIKNTSDHGFRIGQIVVELAVSDYGSYRMVGLKEQGIGLKEQGIRNKRTNCIFDTWAVGKHEVEPCDTDPDFTKKEIMKSLYYLEDELWHDETLTI